MAQNNKKQQLWLIKPNTEKAPDKNCIVLAWQFTKADQEIRYMVYFEDIDIYVESPSTPKINPKGMENIFDWGIPIAEYNLHQTTAQNADFSNNIPKKIQDEFNKKLLEEGADYFTNNNWETASFSVWILAPLLINKIDGIVGINNQQSSNEEIKINNNEENIMAGDITVKVVISEGSKEVLSAPISYNSFATVVSEISDSEANQAFFAEAAKHAAPNVRENVAYKENLDKATVDLLSKDTSVNVLRNLVRTVAFKKYAKQDLIEKLIATDAEVATTIAGDLEAYEQGDMNKSIDLIIKMNNPFVINSIANNYSTPKKVLKTLMSYPDPLIAFDAKARYEDS
jgi:hypothetical protein